jgi:hypothetical protein
MRMRLACSAIGSGALVAALVMPVPAVAATTPVRCGDTIMTSVVLTKNLTCSGDGLLVGATGVTIDLNGHTISGSGSGIGISTSAPWLNPIDSGEFSIINGTIRGFESGVRLVFMSPSADRRTQSHLTHVRIVGNNYGIDGVSAYGIVNVTDSTLKDNRSFGVEVYSSQLHVKNSVLADNGVAMRTHVFSYTSVSGSTFHRNGVGIWCADNGVDSMGNRFVDNDTAIRAWACGASITDNTITGSRLGVDVSDDVYGLNIVNNSFTGGGLGLRVTGGTRQGLGQGIVNNTFARNGASGAELDRSYNANPEQVSVSGNRFRGNGSSPGEFVDPQGKPLTAGLWANFGFLRQNISKGNAGLGIEAYAPAVDGGGNVAKGNGDPDQCLGVICTPAP